MNSKRFIKAGRRIYYRPGDENCPRRGPHKIDPDGSLYWARKDFHRRVLVSINSFGMIILSKGKIYHIDRRGRVNGEFRNAADDSYTWWD
jgi:hypothetical protein